MKRLLSAALALTLVFSLAACGTKTTDNTKTTDSTAPAKNFSIGMVTDTGGINDQSFNQSAWEGLQQFRNDTGAKVNYMESKQESDYVPNLDKLVDQKNDLIWGIGFAMADAVKTAAKQNPNQKYAIIDFAYGNDTPSNLTGVVFKAQEPSFLVGYIAAKTTKTNKVGFVGGIKGDVIDQFEYGYRAGVAYAAKELGKDITVEVQYANSFTDAAAGKAIAASMYTKGCDIVFHAAGAVGLGVIEAAKEANKFVIGVDRDQSSLAPKNVLTSAMKLVGKAMIIVSQEVKDGKNIGGTTQVFGIKEGAAGLPDKNPNVDAAVLTATDTVKKAIVDGKIVAPYNKDTYDSFTKTLK